MNTTDLANGKVNYFNTTYEADYKLSFIDKVHIAITCTQRGWFDNSLGKKKSAKNRGLENYLIVFKVIAMSFSHRVVSTCIIKYKT